MVAKLSTDLRRWFTTPPGSIPSDTRLSPREEIAFMVFTTWCVCGLFLDGWSHNVSKPETFFTPWHALLYSGFGASVGWSMYEANRLRLAGEPPPASTADPLLRVGVALVAVGMVGDFAWHTVFGIERSFEALLSPTHLTLMTGGLLLVSGPLRSALRCDEAPTRRTGREAAPLVVSAAMSTALVAFFLQYASAFRGAQVAELVRLAGIGDVAQANAVGGVVGILVTNLLLGGAIALLVRSGPTPPGTFTATATIMAGLSSGLDGFAHPWLVLAAVAGGAGADLAAHRGRPDLAPLAFAVGAWPVWFAIAATTMPFGWSPNVVGGALLFAVLTALGLRLLAFGEAPRPAPSAPRAPSGSAAPASV